MARPTKPLHSVDEVKRSPHKVESIDDSGDERSTSTPFKATPRSAEKVARRPTNVAANGHSHASDRIRPSVVKEAAAQVIQRAYRQRLARQR